jgi:hypothetical protein
MEFKKCPVCQKDMDEIRTRLDADVCSRACHSRLQKIKWREPLSEQDFETMKTLWSQLPEEGKLLFDDYLKREKFFRRLKKLSLIDL